MPESELLASIQALKIVPRSGWIHAGVGMADVESVAEHSYSVVFLSMILSEKLKAAGSQVNLSVPTHQKLEIGDNLPDLMRRELQVEWDQ